MLGSWINKCYVAKLLAYSLACPNLSRINTFGLLLHLSKWYCPTNHSLYSSCTYKESIAPLEPSLIHFLHQASANSSKNSKHFGWRHLSQSVLKESMESWERNSTIPRPPPSTLLERVCNVRPCSPKTDLPRSCMLWCEPRGLKSRRIFPSSTISIFGVVELSWPQR